MTNGSGSGRINELSGEPVERLARALEELLKKLKKVLDKRGGI